MREWIAEFAMNAFGFMLPFAIIAVVLFVVLIPLAAWKKTGGFAVGCMSS